MYLFDFFVVIFIYVTAAPLPDSSGWESYVPCGKYSNPVGSRRHRAWNIPGLYVYDSAHIPFVVLAVAIDRNLLNILTPSNLSHDLSKETLHKRIVRAE